MAERGGFEPPIRLLAVYRFSKPAPSATRPSLQTIDSIGVLSLLTLAAQSAPGHLSTLGRPEVKQNPPVAREGQTQGRCERRQLHGETLQTGAGNRNRKTSPHQRIIGIPRRKAGFSWFWPTYQALPEGRNHRRQLIHPDVSMQEGLNLDLNLDLSPAGNWHYHASAQKRGRKALLASDRKHGCEFLNRKRSWQ